MPLDIRATGVRTLTHMYPQVSATADPLEAMPAKFIGYLLLMVATSLGHLDEIFKIYSND